MYTYIERGIYYIFDQLDLRNVFSYYSLLSFQEDEDVSSLTSGDEANEVCHYNFY